jgi:bifunctional DNase/RNase
LAARTGAPIYAGEAVLDEAGYVEAETEADDVPDTAESEEVVEQFRDFIDSVNPEDFAS